MSETLTLTEERTEDHNAAAWVRQYVLSLDAEGEAPDAVTVLQAMADRGYRGALLSFPEHHAWAASFIRWDLVPQPSHPVVGVVPTTRLFNGPTAADAVAKAARATLAPGYLVPTEAAGAAEPPTRGRRRGRTTNPGATVAAPAASAPGVSGRPAAGDEVWDEPPPGW